MADSGRDSTGQRKKLFQFSSQILVPLVEDIVLHLKDDAFHHAGFVQVAARAQLPEAGVQFVVEFGGKSSPCRGRFKMPPLGRSKCPPFGQVVCLP